MKKISCPFEGCPRGCTLKYTSECHGKRNPWLCYEAEKRALERRHMRLSPEEYGRRMKGIADRLGL